MWKNYDQTDSKIIITALNCEKVLITTEILVVSTLNDVFFVEKYVGNVEK